MTFLAILSAFLVASAALLTYIMKRFNIVPFVDDIPVPSTDHTITEIPLEAPKQPVQPVSEPTSPNVPPVDKIKICALAQQNFEGWYPGSNSYKRNNPGNCRSVAGPFLVFKTYDEGFAYLEDYIRRVAEGKHSAYPKGGKTTILEYTHIYTSDKEPAPTNYAKAISTALGVPTSTPMSYLLT